MATTKGRKAKKPLTPEQVKAKVQSDHVKLVRALFRGSGFKRVEGVSDKEFTFDNQTTDVDDVFIYENVILVCEYTASQSAGVGSHLKNKKLFYDKVIGNPSGFVDFLKQKFPAAAAEFPSGYHKSKLQVRIVYCSRYEFDDHYKENVPGISYLDYPVLRYFVSVVDAIRKSTRFELFHFLDLELKQIGQDGKIDVSASSAEYHGSLLPEAHSNFEDGYKVVSFYADPDALLKTAYVLRADGWRDSLNLYQRMISRSKVEGIRAYLKREKRVFINNIIVTLPPEIKPVDEDSNTIDASKLVDTAPVKIKLPMRPNSVGLIDGQHRVFAYHETLSDDKEIAALRVQQNLLVTGIIYPEKTSAAVKEKFEAKLFLEINSNQTSAKSTLKQAIGMVLEPFSNESVAARVLGGLARTGPLAGHVQQYFFDTGKLKTTSIVSYGLRPLVKTKGDDALFAIWEHENKNAVVEQKDEAALAEYVQFCIAKINLLLGAMRANLGSARWETDPKVVGRVLTTTYINSFLITLRMLIEKKVPIEFDSLRLSLKGIETFGFTSYHSSQYGKMAEKIVATYFPPQGANRGSGAE
jgi:DGQHR domain-containing protein